MNNSKTAVSKNVTNPFKTKAQTGISKLGNILSITPTSRPIVDSSFGGAVAAATAAAAVPLS